MNVVVFGYGGWCIEVVKLFDVMYELWYSCSMLSCGSVVVNCWWWVCVRFLLVLFFYIVLEDFWFWGFYCCCIIDFVSGGLVCLSFCVGEWGSCVGIDCFFVIVWVFVFVFFGSG